jgi:hypothetical protein
VDAPFRGPYCGQSRPAFYVLGRPSRDSCSGPVRGACGRPACGTEMKFTVQAAAASAVRRTRHGANDRWSQQREAQAAGARARRAVSAAPALRNRIMQLNLESSPASAPLPARASPSTPPLTRPRLPGHGSPAAPWAQSGCTTQLHRPPISRCGAGGNTARTPTERDETAGPSSHASAAKKASRNEGTGGRLPGTHTRALERTRGGTARRPTRGAL